MDTERRCPGCFDDHLPGSPDCPAGRLGEVLDGRFRLDAILGAGGFGAVFRAVHLGLVAPFAIKALLPRLARNESVVERFLREARTAASLDHPGIVRVTDVGLDHGIPWLAMELLEGEALSERIVRRGALQAPEALAIADAVLEALAYAHRRGVIHRDIKPHNIFLVTTDDGSLRVKLLDFGLAKVVAEEAAPQLTQTGEFLGTLQYASPEQVSDARSADPRSDVYGIGAVLFAMVTGRSPASARTASEVLSQVVTGRIERHPQEINPAVPGAIDAVVARALAFEPNDRPASAEALRRELAAARDDAASMVSAPTLMLPAIASLPGERSATLDTRDTPGRRRTWPAVAITLAAVGLAVTVFVLRSPSRTARTATPVNAPAATPPVAPDGMVLIPAGSFTMGSTEDEVAAAHAWCRELDPTCPESLFSRELPRRSVELSPFAIDQNEVTNTQFAAWLRGQADIMARVAPRHPEHQNSGPGKQLFLADVRLADLDLHPGSIGLEVDTSGRIAAVPGRESWPVVFVTWWAARDYCADQGKRLPTEAEWERVARGPARATFPWGEGRPDCNRVVVANAGSSSCLTDGTPAAVAGAPGDRSSEGIADLGGNASEWVADSFVEPYPACPEPCRDPVVTSGSEFRVFRGSDFGNDAVFARAAGRSRRHADAVGPIGFRCARDLT